MSKTWIVPLLIVGSMVAGPTTLASASRDQRASSRDQRATARDQRTMPRASCLRAYGGPTYTVNYTVNYATCRKAKGKTQAPKFKW
jgi:hypothetical protein